MIVPTKFGQWAGGNVFTQGPNQTSYQCTDWGYCKPIGQGTKSENIIGAAAYSLTCIFGKGGCGGLQTHTAASTACADFSCMIGPFMPVILLVAGGLVLYTFVKH